MMIQKYIIATAVSIFLGGMMFPQAYAQEIKQGACFPAELIRENLPIYLTYLRINQNKPIKGVETMGGAGIIETTSAATITCKLVLMILAEEGREVPSELYYKISDKAEIKVAPISLIPCDYGIVNGRVNLEIPRTNSLSGYRIIVSLDGEDWYPYVFFKEGFLLELLRSSALPLDEHENRD